jgi:pyridoxal phosphate enzyme (YggS family)
VAKPYLIGRGDEAPSRYTARAKPVDTSSIRATLQDRYAAVEERIQAACFKAKRDRNEITLVTVTKTISVEFVNVLVEMGVVHLGESRPQELWRKAAALPSACRWHLVGHLQRNKIERTLQCNPLIHSVDSIPLLQTLDREATKKAKTVVVLLEVNASGEPQKHGFNPEQVPSAVGLLPSLTHVRVAGLMTMAALEDDPEHCRPTFAVIRDLANQLAGEVRPPHSMAQFSMGMSNDFEIAIEEGATLIRIGTALVGDLPS